MRARPILLAVGFVVASLVGTWVLLVVPVFVSIVGAAAGLVGLLADDDLRARLLAITRRAMKICDISNKSAAVTLEMHEADVSKVLAGERRLDEGRFAALGEEFVRTKAFLVLDELGLPRFAKNAVKIDAALPTERRAA